MDSTISVVPPAVDIEALATALLLRLSPKEPSRPKLPAPDVLERYDAWQRSRRVVASWERDRGVIEIFLEQTHLEDFGDLTTARMNEYLASRAAAGRKPKTLNRDREVLHSLFVWLVDQDLAWKNPIAKVKRAPEPAPSIRALSMAEIDRVLELVSGHKIYPLIATLILAGLRLSEALWLRPADVDLVKKRIHIRARADGAWQPKTRRNRGIPISVRLFPLLEAAAASSRFEWIFPAPRGGRWHPRNLHRVWRALLKPHALPWTFLDLRHTFATRLVMNNVSLAKISALMGNSPEICRKHYAHIATEDLSADVEF